MLDLENLSWFLATLMAVKAVIVQLKEAPAVVCIFYNVHCFIPG